MFILVFFSTLLGGWKLIPASLKKNTSVLSKIKFQAWWWSRLLVVCSKVKGAWKMIFNENKQWEWMSLHKFGFGCSLCRVWKGCHGTSLSGLLEVCGEHSYIRTRGCTGDAACACTNATGPQGGTHVILWDERCTRVAYEVGLHDGVCVYDKYTLCYAIFFFQYIQNGCMCTCRVACIH